MGYQLGSYCMVQLHNVFCVTLKLFSLSFFRVSLAQYPDDATARNQSVNQNY